MVVTQPRHCLDRRDRIGHQIDRAVEHDRDILRHITPARQQVEIELTVIRHRADHDARDAMRDHPADFLRGQGDIRRVITEIPVARSDHRMDRNTDATAWATNASDGVSPPRPSAPHSSIRSAPAATTASTPAASSTQISSSGGLGRAGGIAILSTP